MLNAATTLRQATALVAALGMLGLLLLAPLHASHALQRFAGLGAGHAVEVCTADGILIVHLPAHDDQHPQSVHCPVCALAKAIAPPPAAAAATVVRIAFRVDFPPAAVAAAGGVVAGLPQARAPPAVV